MFVVLLVSAFATICVQIARAWLVGCTVLPRAHAAVPRFISVCVVGSVRVLAALSCVDTVAGGILPPRNRARTCVASGEGRG